MDSAIAVERNSLPSLPGNRFAEDTLHTKDQRIRSVAHSTICVCEKQFPLQTLDPVSRYYGHSLLRIVVLSQRQAELAADHIDASFTVAQLIVFVDGIVQPKDTVTKLMQELHGWIERNQRFGRPAKFGEIAEVESEIPDHVPDSSVVLIVHHRFDFRETYSWRVIVVFEPE